MGYTNVALKDRIMEMHPEIEEHGISLSLDFNRQLKTYDIKLEKNSHRLVTHLEKKDADECMDGIKCISLAVRISEFTRNFKEK
jgi:hypothetical protein